MAALDHSQTDSGALHGIHWSNESKRFILLGDGDLIRHGDEMYADGQWITASPLAGIELNPGAQFPFRRSFKADAEIKNHARSR